MFSLIFGVPVMVVMIYFMVQMKLHSKKHSTGNILKYQEVSNSILTSFLQRLSPILENKIQFKWENFFFKNYEGKGNFLHEFDFHPQKPLLLGLCDTLLVPFTDGYSQKHSVDD